MDDRRGERFGRYEILTELGRGAMGVVYKARDPRINRVVAVKTISLAGQSPEEQREYRERFFREAEAAGRLSHPGIVTIFDVGEEPQTQAPYIVMEYVGGESLDKVLSRNDHKLPLDTALQLTQELAEALDCAHGQGVVHRDLKPANILLTEDGHAKIADFGVAKLNLANHTLAGRALGTPAYMSPEQLNGEPVDGRSDLFSLGVVLYTVLTGYRPFQGNSAITVSFKVVNRDPVPATILDSDLPQGLDSIIQRAMAKDPADRYQRGKEMVLDIQGLQEGREPVSAVKATGSPASVSPAHAINESAPLSMGHVGIAARLLDSARALVVWNDVEENLLQKIRSRSIAGALVLVGLLILGLRVISYGPPALPPRALELPPPVAKFASVKTAPTQPAATVAAPPSAAPKAVKQRPKSVVAATQTRPHVAKVAHASSPAVSAVATAETSPAPSPATLEIEVDHKFAEANLSIWVDDRLAYTHLLEGTDRKHLVVFHHVEGHEFHAVPVPPGKHRLRVQVTSDAANYDQTATVAGDFASGQENVLHINFTKHGDMSLSLQ
jgi:eukaryotic-like serine/threonine-protein kinase